MKGPSIDFIIGLVIGVLLTFAVSIKATIDAKHVWQKATIDRGFAEYNQTNGNWQWKSLDKDR